jgi:hypothetical protein
MAVLVFGSLCIGISMTLGYYFASSVATIWHNQKYSPAMLRWIMLFDGWIILGIICSIVGFCVMVVHAAKANISMTESVLWSPEWGIPIGFLTAFFLIWFLIQRGGKAVTWEEFVNACVILPMGKTTFIFEIPPDESKVHRLIREINSRSIGKTWISASITGRKVILERRTRYI